MKKRTSPRRPQRYRAIADYYDAEYAHYEMLHNDVPFLLGHLPRRRQRVLELAVGTARAAIPIAQAGHRVVGVDNAPDMLDIARRKRDGVGLGERELQLIQGDVLRLELGETFDWVVILFNTLLSFPTLPQLDRLMEVVMRHLRRGGRFWVDVFQPNLALLAQEVSENLDPVVFYVPALDRTVFKTTEVRRDPAVQVQHIIFHYHWFDAEGQQHHETTPFDLTFLFPRELQLLMERHGLRIERMYGNYDGSALDADSPRMIACCVK